MALLSTFDRYYNLGAAEPKSTLDHIYPQKRQRIPILISFCPIREAYQRATVALHLFKDKKKRILIKKRGLQEPPQYKHTKAQNHACTPAAIRTQNLLLRGQSLYPIEILEQNGFPKAVMSGKVEHGLFKQDILQFTNHSCNTFIQKIQ